MPLFTGAGIGAALSLVLLDTDLFAPDLGWRIAFGLGAVLGLGILLVRRHVPQSPRWLFIHGRNQQAEELVGEVERQTGERLDEVEDSIRIRQRKSIGFGVIAQTAFKLYPYLIGAALMIAAGIAGWLIGVEAAGRSLEDVARPLSAEEADATA